MSKIKIDGTLSGFGTQIFIDGEEVRKVAGVDVHIACGQRTIVKLDMVIPPEVETEADVLCYSRDTSVENLILNREDKELLEFGDKIIAEIERRRKERFKEKAEKYAYDRFNNKND